MKVSTPLLPPHSLSLFSRSPVSLSPHLSARVSGCGYGCQLHHAVYCLVVAFASRRTLVLESAGWRYQPDGGWDSVFQPISRTCLISNAALLALEKRANDTASSNAANAASQSRTQLWAGGSAPMKGKKQGCAIRSSLRHSMVITLVRSEFELEAIWSLFYG